jgi:alpha-glucosidase (family GH31 glycosyl hydrolase)
MHYVVIVDPGVSGSEPPGSYPPYDRGLEMDVFIKNSSGNVFIGQVWNPNSTVWPDFTHPNATSYWTGLIGDFYKQVSGYQRLSAEIEAEIGAMRRLPLTALGST